MPDLKPADLELLSAYLDDALLPEERAALEVRLLAEPALRAELDALRTVVDQVRALPEMTAPRDFRLDPAIYGRKTPAQPVRVSRQAAASRAYYRWGSAVSALAAAITLVIGVLGLLRPQFNNAVVLMEAVQMDDGAAQRAVEAPQDAAPSAVAVLPTLAVTSQPLAGRGTGESGGVGNSTDAESGMPPASTVVNAVPLEALESAAEEGVALGAVPEADTFAADSIAEEESDMGPATAFGMGGGGATAAPLPSMPPPAAAEALQAPGAEAEQLPSAAEPNIAAQAAPLQDEAEQATKSLVPTLPVTEIALLPTPTAAPTLDAIAQSDEAEMQAAEQPTTSPELQAVEDRAGLRLDPGMFIGASMVLLALAVALLALSRRR